MEDLLGVDKNYDLKYVITYWYKILDCLLSSWDVMERQQLKFGFWTCTNHSRGYYSPQIIVRLRINTQSIFWNKSQKMNCKKETRYLLDLHMSQKRFDVKSEKFILSRPYEDFVIKKCLWRAWALSLILRDITSSHIHEVEIKW